ncbi:MAG: acyl-CoA desaturase [Planctomycetaceae bacterium]|nr:acyl-CoA desaturase [Planctomycetaceae bacterium]
MSYDPTSLLQPQSDDAVSVEAPRTVGSRLPNGSAEPVHRAAVEPSDRPVPEHPYAPSPIVTGGPTAPPSPRQRSGWVRALRSVAAWFDTWATADAIKRAHPHKRAVQRVEWIRILPFALLHLSCLTVIFVGWSPVAVGVALGMYVLRMFAITGFYHRYFSHKSFKSSRAFQFVMALVGASATQRGPLWWASHHRRHHQNSDKPEDVHSPKQHGFWWSHVGWISTRENFPTDFGAVRDLVRYPELRFLDRFDIVVPTLTGVAMFLLGVVLEAVAPSLGTNGWQMLVWGFLISTVVLAHATFTINSLSHVFGSRRYETTDTSRNNPLLALLTMGEGWHNNHHHYQASTRQGFYWWEFDLTYYGLVVLSWFGLIWDLRPVPREVRDGRVGRGSVRS